MKFFKKSLITTLALALIVTNNFTTLASDDYPNASNWALVELSMADDDGFVTESINSDFSKDITREGFCEIAVILYDRLGGTQELETYNPFTDTTNPIIIKAYNAGIINGVGNNLFAPDANLSRQELCVMIIRAMKASGIRFGDDHEYTYQQNYTDEDSISSWATTEVRVMNDFKIMNGTGDRLEPLASLSVEQAIIMLERTFLRDFTIEDSTLIAYTGNSSDITIPNGITTLNDYVFDDNQLIETVTLPLTTTTIGYASFRSCYNLKNINLNEGLLTIGEAAFESSKGFEYLTLPSTLQTIEFMGIQDCESLISISLPASLTTLGDQAFYSCESLTRVIFNNNTISIGSSAFEDCNYVVFVCDEGSTAHQYAIANNIDFELN
jgi:hypothetical protein